jgi:hypothetical protein
LRSLGRFVCFGWLVCAVAHGVAGVAAADNTGHVSCDILENGQPASGVVSLQLAGQEVVNGACGKDIGVPAGTYIALLRLDGALDGPEQRQTVNVEAGGSAKLRADFATGTLEVRIVSLGKRAAGMAILKRAGQQLGTLGSGVAAHLSAGTYHVFARYRAEEKDLGDVNIAGGQRVTLNAAFE